MGIENRDIISELLAMEQSCGTPIAAVKKDDTVDQGIVLMSGLLKAIITTPKNKTN